ncbi:MAG TPA: hypothetical protein VG737_13610 [Cyclobacteriaceae bacterium]|nr:hypothetical protein [Cyclobacteriaceae bacterium]
MKKIFVSLSMVVILSATSVAQDTESNCQMANVIVVDGKADEWTLTWVESDDKNFSYNVCSDDNNLYVRMKTSNDMIKRKIGLFGLTLWMDPNGKKKRRLGFKFPSGTEGAERMEAFRKESESQNHERQSAGERAEFQKKMEADLIQNLEVIELIGLTDDPITATRSGITNGIKVAIALDPESRAYVYEAVLPFKSYRLSKKSIETLGVGFETGKYTPPKDKNANSGQYVPQGGVGNNGGRGGYQGGFGGRGYGSYGAGGGGPRGSHPMSSASFCWFTVKMK